MCVEIEIRLKKFDKNKESSGQSTKALFIWGKTPHLPDPGLTGEVNFSHCLYEISHLACQGEVN